MSDQPRVRRPFVRLGQAWIPFWELKAAQQYSPTETHVSFAHHPAMLVQESLADVLVWFADASGMG